MKNLLYILFISISLPLFSQWKTVKGEYIHNYRPFNQFTINHYTNEIWLVNPFNATVIKSDGSFVTFGESELGSLWHDDKLNFGFTSSHTFFTKELTGLYLFDNYQKQLLYNDNDFQRVYNDLDTLYLVRFNGHLIKYSYNNLVENTGLNATHCAINKGDIYTNRGSYFYVENNVDYPLWNESFYLQSIATGAMLFKPETDTVFLGQQTGITKCRDGSCFDTITPNNTTNMPSGNILEIEFDANNDLWVAFGDTNDEFIALGKLEGSTWTEVYTAANSPINFDLFYGFEFDTLGNIWVASDKDLHTLENSNSPDWLSNHKFTIETPQISVYPNPATTILHVQLPNSVKKAELSISDINGKVVKEETLNSSSATQLNIEELEKGVYILKVVSKDNQWQKKLVKQ